MQRLYSKQMTSLPLVNISIVGMNGSGKSAIVVKYLTNRFIVEYAPFLSDNYSKTDSIDGQDFTLNIQDTSDSDEINLDDVMRWSHAVIVVFSITSRRSFYRAKELVESLKQCMEQRSSHPATSSSLRPPLPSSLTGSASPSLAKPSSMPPIMPGYMAGQRRAVSTGTTAAPRLILVANKSDLDRFRLVERAEAEDYATTHKIAYIETTATEYWREVQAMFHNVVRLTTTAAATTATANTTALAMSTPGSRNGKLRLSSVGASLASPPSPVGTSVLSSLAATPGLLLPKKSPTPSLTAIGESSAEATDSTTGPSTSNNGISLAPSVSPVSLLTNLRFRAASPPAFGKTLRSPSPGWVTGGARNPTTGPGTGVSTRPISCSAAVDTQKPSSTAVRTHQAASALSVLVGDTTQPIPATSRSTSQLSTEAAPTTQVAQVTKVKTIPAEAVTATKTTVQPASTSQTIVKKSTSAFRFFGKKAK